MASSIIMVPCSKTKNASKVEQLETHITILSRLYVALWEKEMQKHSLKLTAKVPK